MKKLVKTAVTAPQNREETKNMTIAKYLGGAVMASAMAVSSYAQAADVVIVKNSAACRSETGQ